MAILNAVLFGVVILVTLQVAGELYNHPEVLSGTVGRQAAPEVSQEAEPASPTQAEYVPQTPFVIPGETQTLHVVDASGQQREYVLHVGARYDVDNPQPMPVMFAFHGWKVQASQFAHDSGFDHTAAWDEAMVVFPQGLEQSWPGAPYSVASFENEDAFVHTILAELDAHYAIDRARVYLTGMSNGAGYAYSLGCRQPHTFAAMALVSGAYYLPVTHNCEDYQLPTLLVHGEQDQIIHYEGGQRHEAEYLAPRAAADMQAMRNRCVAVDPQPLEVGGMQRFIYPHCVVEMEHWKFIGKRHVWLLQDELPAEVWTFLQRQFNPEQIV